MKKLSPTEELLVELVHFMSEGTDFSLREIKQLLLRPIPSKNGKNCLECLETEGRAFLNELITFINELES